MANHLLALEKAPNGAFFVLPYNKEKVPEGGYYFVGNFNQCGIVFDLIQQNNKLKEKLEKLTNEISSNS
jgi:hypothetical protein